MYRVYSGCYKATLEPRRKRRLGEHSHYGGEKPTFLTLPTSRLKTLTHLVERAKTTKLAKSERQALDIFVVAFVTMSRVGEIAALHVDEVGRRGETVTIRPKTKARTWQKATKKVSNIGGLEAREILRDHREAARRKGRVWMFTGKGDNPPETSTITRRLKELATKLGANIRISAHAARKGAAVEAVLAGIPLPVVQALGTWQDINTLQAYIGEAVRRATPWMEITAGKERTLNTLRRHKEETRTTREGKAKRETRSD